MSWNAPIQATTGQVVTAAFWNAQIYDNFVDVAASGLIRLGGTMEASADLTLSTSFESGATVSFVPPASWGTYDLTAWGSARFGENFGDLNPITYGARVSIAGVAGTEGTVKIDPDATTTHSHAKARHIGTGLSGTSSVVLQYRRVSGVDGQKHSSIVSLVAIRAS